MPPSSRTISVRDIQEPGSQPKSGVYTHGVLSISSQRTIGDRFWSWYFTVLLLVLPPVLLTFVALSSSFRPALDALEIWPQQYQYIPGALLLQGYVALISLCAVDAGAMTIFVRGAERRTVPILVSKDSTIDDVLDTLRKRGHIPSKSHRSHALYMSGRLQRLLGYLIMAELNIGSLSHFDIRVRVLGGSNDASSSSQTGDAGPSTADGRPARQRGSLMAQYLEAENQDEFGNPVPVKRKIKRVRHRQNNDVSEKPRGKGKGKAPAKGGRGSHAEESGDEQDADYGDPGSDGSESSNDESVRGLNEEVSGKFSGGRDTISLRRSSLKADTVRTLMLVKNRLRMALRDITARLGD
ncbi:hypothetical protein B0H10DRAFT_1971364 [Mycena sp. CBHHK59/15]|nr:hypothetical protein B0H10DRAFT_1971364 [Mycena sp. CBHHK59/15]